MRLVCTKNSKAVKPRGKILFIGEATDCINYMHGYIKLFHDDLDIKLINGTGLSEKSEALIKIVKPNFIVLFSTNSISELEKVCDINIRVLPEYSSYDLAKVTMQKLFHVSLEVFWEILKDSKLDYLMYIKNYNTFVRKQIVNEANNIGLCGTSEIEEVSLLMKKINENTLDFFKQLSFQDQWNGFSCKRFYFEGYEATIISPIEESNLWVWKVEFLDEFPVLEIEMLNQGYHVVNIRLSHLYGNDYSIGVMKRFRDFIVKEYKFVEQCGLIAISRGGLYGMGYTNQFPEDVSSLFLDAAVVDLLSWPKEHATSPEVWEDCRAMCELGENYIGKCHKILEQKLKKLFDSKVPVMIVAGDSDTIVPFEENSQLLVSYFKERGNDIPVILKSGCNHHPHSLENPEPIVNFFCKNI